MRDVKLVTVTRADISPGYQLVQTAHAIAEFAYEQPQLLRQWKTATNTLVSLVVADEEELNKLCESLTQQKATFVRFTEPDIGDQLTAVCIYGVPDIRKRLAHLRLALKDYNAKENV